MGKCIPDCDYKNLTGNICNACGEEYYDLDDEERYGEPSRPSEEL